MTTPHKPLNPNTPVVLLLAVLILGGLGWSLWPRAESPAELDASRESHGEPTLALEPAELERLGPAKASVSGRVSERGGAPLADATVCATSDPDALLGRAPAKFQCVRSGSDGRYRLLGLWPVQTRLVASAAGHVPQAWRTRDARGRWREHVTLVPERETTAIDFELVGGGVRVAGVVEDLGGGEIEGAWVSVGDPEQPSSTVAVSDAEGRFELWAKPGEIVVHAQAEGYAPSQRRSLAPSERVELYLTPESALIGRVVDAETGEGVPDLTVLVETSTGDAVRSDADGKFRIDGLPPGVYKPRALGDEWFGEAAVQVHLGLGQTALRVEIPVHPVASVAGRVTIAGTTEGCSEGSVELRGIHERVSVDSDDEGRVIFRGVREGEYEIEVHCAGLVSGDYPNVVVVGAEPLVDQVWEVREGLAIRGVVVDSEGRPVGDARVSARLLVDVANARTPQRSSPNDASEPDGSFEIAGLLAGRYQIFVSAEQPAPDAPQTVELEPGVDRNDVRIELPASATIVGRVIDEQGNPQPGVQVVTSLLGKRRDRDTMTDDAGNFRLEYVSIGTHRVQAQDQHQRQSMRAPGSSDDDLQGERVEVGAGEQVEVELRVESRSGVIRGRVLDEHGGPVDDAFIQVDRLSQSASASASRSRSEVHWGMGSEPILSDVDGSFTIDELAAGIYLVRAFRRGGGEAIAERVELGSNVELTIAPTGLLAGKVVVAGGSPPERFRIVASDPAQGLSFADRYFRTEGEWQLSELPAGNYEVFVESDAGTAELAVELAAGARREDLELTVQPRVTVHGRLVDIDDGAPVPGMRVSIRSRKGGVPWAKPNKSELEQISDAEGRFTVIEVPTGEVRILVTWPARSSAPAYGTSTILRELGNEPAVQELGDLALVRRRLGPHEAAGDLGFETKAEELGTPLADQAIRVGLIRAGGPASTSGLAVGDVIESVDGKPLDAAEHARWRWLTSVPAGTVLEFGIREGKTVTITVGPAI